MKISKNHVSQTSNIQQLKNQHRLWCTVADVSWFLTIKRYWFNLSNVVDLRHSSISDFRQSSVTGFPNSNVVDFRHSNSTDFWQTLVNFRHSSVTNFRYLIVAGVQDSINAYISTLDYEWFQHSSAADFRRSTLA